MRDIKIAYIIPGIGLSEDEVRRRYKIANSIIGDIGEVDILTVDEGPLSIENAVEEAFAATSYLPKLHLECNNYDAFIIGCFGDPGLRAARELCDKVVVGPAEASMHIASLISDKFSILTPLDTLVPMTNELARLYGFSEQLASVIPVEIPVMNFINKREESIDFVSREIKSKLSDSSGSLILGCMSMGFALIDEYIKDTLGIPIINPVKISIKIAWLLSSLGLTHSRVTYPPPNFDKLQHLLVAEGGENSHVEPS